LIESVVQEREEIDRSAVSACDPSLSRWPSEGS